MKSFKVHLIYWLIIAAVGFGGYSLFSMLEKTQVQLKNTQKQNADSAASIESMKAELLQAKKTAEADKAAVQDKPLPMFFVDAPLDKPNVDNAGIQVWANMVAVKATPDRPRFRLQS